MKRRNVRKSNGSRRKGNRARMAAEGRPCWICEAFGRPSAIDYSLKFPHPMSFELDELVPVSRYWEGGYQTPEECALDYGNNAATHRCCNNWRKNKSVQEVMILARRARAGGQAKGPFVPREIEQPVEF